MAVSDQEIAHVLRADEQHAGNAVERHLRQDFFDVQYAVAVLVLRRRQPERERVVVLL